MDKSDLKACHGCGEFVPISKLRKCKKCGLILCPKCRKKHKNCESKQAERQLTPIGKIDIINTPVILVDNIIVTERRYTDINGGNYNPQCNIKLSDMRIYEIARNPEWMTEHERWLVENDPDVRRRYYHYETVIKTKGD